jgi:hypothetical protein
MYQTLTRKLEALKSGDELPLAILTDNFMDEFGIIYSPDENIPEFQLKDIESFTFESFNKNKKVTVELKLLQLKKPVRFYLEQTDFFNMTQLRKDWDAQFAFLKPGCLAFLGEYKTFFMNNVEEMLRYGLDNMGWEISGFNEGEVVCILEKHKMDDFKLVKILHKDTVYWSYAAFYDAEQLKSHANEQHYI